VIRLRTLAHRLWARHELRVAAVLVPAFLAAMTVGIYLGVQEGNFASVPGAQLPPTTTRTPGGPPSPTTRPLSTAATTGNIRPGPNPSRSPSSDTPTRPRTATGLPDAPDASISVTTIGSSTTSSTSTPPGSGGPNPTTTTAPPPPSSEPSPDPGPPTTTQISAPSPPLSVPDPTLPEIPPVPTTGVP
jgi:hypothetical protein